MKKIFVLLFSIILILTGCSSDKTTVDYYINNGYTDLGSTGYGYDYEVDGETIYDEEYSALEKQIGENQVMKIMYDNGEIIGFRATYTINDVFLELVYDMNDENYYCSAYNDVTQEHESEVGCSNTFVYIEENAPELAAEFSSVSENLGISMDSLIIGDSQQVEEAVKSLETE